MKQAKRKVVVAKQSPRTVKVTVKGTNKQDVDQVRNLIRAAPELLRVCKEALNQFSKVYQECDWVQEIARVVGKVEECTHTQTIPNDDPEYPLKCAYCCRVFGKDGKP
jgi:hypothetical protein